MDNLPVRIIYRNEYLGLLYLLSFYKEFRTLFYARTGDIKYILKIFCPGLPTLAIPSRDIGEGLFIQHGISTIIGAKSIGKNCTVNQQVTIASQVVLKDYVRVATGAVIVGKTTIGNNVFIGANVTITKDIPDNSTVYPPSPKVMTWKTDKISKFK